MDTKYKFDTFDCGLLSIGRKIKQGVRRVAPLDELSTKTLSEICRTPDPIFEKASMAELRKLGRRR